MVVISPQRNTKAGSRETVLTLYLDPASASAINRAIVTIQASLSVAPTVRFKLDDVQQMGRHHFQIHARPRPVPCRRQQVLRPDGESPATG
jgi:hypothetical protein